MLLLFGTNVFGASVYNMRVQEVRGSKLLQYFISVSAIRGWQLAIGGSNTGNTNIIKPGGLRIEIGETMEGCKHLSGLKGVSIMNLNLPRGFPSQSWKNTYELGITLLGEPAFGTDC